MSNTLTLGPHQHQIVNALVNAPNNWEERITIGSMKEPEGIPLFQWGWVTVDYLKKKCTKNVVQTRDLDYRLADEKNLVLKSKFNFLNKTQAQFKSRGNKYKSTGREIYRINPSKLTFKKLFLYYYKKGQCWDFLHSRYVSECYNNPLEDRWQRSRRWVNNYFIKENIGAFEKWDELQYISPVFLNLLYSNPNKLNSDWETYFNFFKEKCFSYQASDLLSFLKLLEAFWTYELFALSEEDDKKYNLKEKCVKMLTVVRALAIEVQKNSRPLKKQNGGK